MGGSAADCSATYKDLSMGGLSDLGCAFRDEAAMLSATCEMPAPTRWLSLGGGHMHEFLLWVTSVRYHLVVWLTGSVVAVAMVLIDKLTDWSVPKWIYVVVVAATLVAACFESWRLEFRRAEGLQASLDDRRRQQEMADDYKPCLHTGHKISVRWADAVRQKDDAILGAVSHEAFAWYEGVSALWVASFRTVCYRKTD